MNEAGVQMKYFTVLPHLNAMSDVQDMTPHPTNLYKRSADVFWVLLLLKTQGNWTFWPLCRPYDQ